MQVLNQTSYIIFAAVVLSLASFLLLRGRTKRTGFFFIAGLAALLVGAWLVLKPVPSTDSDSGSIKSQLGSGTPVLMEIQSPY